MTPYAEKTKSGDVVWRVAYYVKGRRVRQTFDSKTQAVDWARINRGIGSREGRRFQKLWLSITPKEQHEALDALSLMRAHRKKHPQSSLTLVQAAAAQITVAEEIQSSLLLAEAVDRYIETKKGNKRKGSVSPGWFVVLDKCLHRAARELPNKTLAEFGTEEIEEWLDDQDWVPRTFNNYRDYLYSVFKWAVPQYVKRNPIAGIQKYAKKFCTREVIVPDVATVARIFRLMLKKRYRHLLPARDLCFGLALRSSEATEMVWENIREHVIQVPNAIAKGGRGRNISHRPLLDGIFQSLLAQKGNQTGPILPRGWRRDLTKLFEEAGLGKPRNVMRKSAGSYHYYATGDEALTKAMMSHTEHSKMFIDSYQALNYAIGESKITHLPEGWHRVL